MLHQDVAAIDNSIGEKKLSVGNFPSVCECAALSLDVYYAIGASDRPPPPAGWDRKDSVRYDDDYFGACYTKEINGIPIIVIANRGTVPTAVGTIFADIQTALKKTLLQFKSMKKFMHNTFDELVKKYGQEKMDNSVIVFTGHSLGSILSDFGASLLIKSPVDLADNLKSITFENPGAKPCIISYLKSERNLPFPIQTILMRLNTICEAYQADVNVVNTVNEKVGKVYRLKIPYDLFVAPEIPIPMDIPTLFYLNDHYMGGYTFFDQHKIEKIYEYLQADGAIVPTQFPSDPISGYSAYLDYDARSDYWTNYFKACWDIYPDLKISYLGSFEKFSNAAEIKVRELHDIVAASKPSHLDIDSNSIETLSTDTINIGIERSISTSSLGLFALGKSAVSGEEDLYDFVIIDKDGPNQEDTANKGRCSIM